MYLHERERSAATAEKYARAAHSFLDFAEELKDAPTVCCGERGLAEIASDTASATSAKDGGPFYRSSAVSGASAKEDDGAHLCVITKETVIAYKRHLQQSAYAVASVNAAIAGINCRL